jgi:hypothetical protein
VLSICRSGECASCGSMDEDSLYADELDIQRYAGKSALQAIESLELYFSFRASWIVNNHNDALFKADRGM